MITFKQFLSEAELQELATILKNDCKQFLSENNHGYLRRGVENLRGGKTVSIDGENVLLYSKRVRTDRSSLSTSRTDQKIMDDWFLKKFNVKPRSGAAFMLGMKAADETVKFYGVPCMVFPIGNYKAIWSPKIDDLFEHMDIQDKVLDSTGEDKHLSTADQRKTRITKLLDEGDYQNSNIGEAIQGKMEIMVVCDAYYAIPMVYKVLLKEMMEKL